MRLLFAITVGCFCAVLWVALALARRIRLGQLLMARPPRPHVDPTHEFFEAGEFRTPRPLRLDQEILQQKPRRPLSDFTFAATSTQFATTAAPNGVTADPKKPRASAPPIPIRPAAAYATLNGKSVPITRINPFPNAPAARRADDTAIPNSVPALLPSAFTTLRKPPQSVRPTARRRIDLNSGDLVDPYDSLRRGSGTKGPVISSRPDRRRDVS